MNDHLQDAIAIGFVILCYFGGMAILEWASNRNDKNGDKS